MKKNALLVKAVLTPVQNDIHHKYTVICHFHRFSEYSIRNSLFSYYVYDEAHKQHKKAYSMDIS